VVSTYIFVNHRPDRKDRPHLPAHLGGDNQLVAVGLQVLVQDAAEVNLRAAKRRAELLARSKSVMPRSKAVRTHLPLGVE